jgi:hypothetical protein
MVYAMVHRVYAMVYAIVHRVYAMVYAMVATAMKLCIYNHGHV